MRSPSLCTREAPGDLLTAYNGTAITYDEIGNRLTDGTWTYTWEHGRELASMSNGTNIWTFTYDANGLRTRRSDYNSSDAGYTYQYDGNGRLVCMSANGQYLYFGYDPVSGVPQTITYNGQVFYYVTNTRGDVLGITSVEGTLLAAYEYDAWGNVLYTYNANYWNIAQYNPLLYRGYVYDWETGLYYLQSRYYDPEIGRFINADAYAATGQGLTGNNMFAYCGNNPVNRFDLSGLFWDEIGDWLKEVGKKIEEYFTPSNVYGFATGTSSIVSTASVAALQSSIRSTPRPNNIGAGIFAKQCAKELEQVSKFGNTSSRILSYAGYGVAVIDVGIGIHNNINNGASTKKIVLDATVDAAMTGGSIWAAGTAGGSIGTAVGSVIPGAGNIVGAAAGFIIGIGIYVVTDMVHYNGKTAREWVKEGVNSLW